MCTKLFGKTRQNNIFFAVFAFHVHFTGHATNLQLSSALRVASGLIIAFINHSLIFQEVFIQPAARWLSLANIQPQWVSTQHVRNLRRNPMTSAHSITSIFNAKNTPKINCELKCDISVFGLSCFMLLTQNPKQSLNRATLLHNRNIPCLDC